MIDELEKAANLLETGDSKETELTAIAIRIVGIGIRNYTGKLRNCTMRIAFAIADFDEELESKKLNL